MFAVTSALGFAIASCGTDGEPAPAGSVGSSTGGASGSVSAGGAPSGGASGAKGGVGGASGAIAKGGAAGAKAGSAGAAGAMSATGGAAGKAGAAGASGGAGAGKAGTSSAGGASAGAGGSPPPPPTCGCFSGDGLYCGKGVNDYGAQHGCAVALAMSQSGDVLDCHAGAWTVKQTCTSGCFVAPAGTNDGCNAAPGGYHLPWKCGVTFDTTQGNDGDICGSSQGDHTGVQKFAFDFGLPLDTPVLAARAGTVTVAAEKAPAGASCHDGCQQPFGTQAFWDCCNACLNTANFVNVAHGDGTVMTYWHFDKVTVTVGQAVKQGDQLGLSGTSGCSSGPHLHTQLMGNCPTGYCQSLPLDYAEAGAPKCGQKVTSQNCP